MDNMEQKEINILKVKYPDKIPIIVNKAKNDTIDQVVKNKFLVPKYITTGQFTYILRKRLELQEHTALFILFNNKLMPSNKCIDEIYNEQMDKTDGFLYVCYTNENTFG